MTKLILTLVVLVCSVAIVRADESATVILANDSSYTGTLLVKTANEVVLRLADGTVKSIPQSTVREIIQHESDKSALWKSRRGDPRSFGCIGGTIGTPAGLNLRGGFHAGAFAIHGSGMYLGDLNGFQVSPMLTLGQSDYTEHYLSAVFGFSNVPVASYYYSTSVKSWTYAGLGYVLHSHGFLFEFGLSGGSGNFTSPQILIQLGYVHKL